MARMALHENHFLPKSSSRITTLDTSKHPCLFKYKQLLHFLRIQPHHRNYVFKLLHTEVSDICAQSVMPTVRDVSGYSETNECAAIGDKQRSHTVFIPQ